MERSVLLGDRAEEIKAGMGQMGRQRIPEGPDQGARLGVNILGPRLLDFSL